MRFGWETDIFSIRDVIIERHVSPSNDLQQHVLSPDCWCKPVEAEDRDKLYIHNAADGRLIVEDHEGTMH